MKNVTATTSIEEVIPNRPVWSTMRHWTERIGFLQDYASQNRVLHIGCGTDGGFGTRLDISAEVRPEIIADLNAPLPFLPNTWDGAIALNIVEHLQDPLSVITELHRVVRPGGLVAMLVPHFASSARHVDPTHRFGFSARSFDYLVSGSEQERSYAWYSTARFKPVHRRIDLQSPKLNALLGGLVNRRSVAFEDHFCYLLRPAGVYFEFLVL